MMMNTRLAVAAVVLLFGLLLAGQEAAGAGYDAPAAKEPAPAAKKDAAGYAPTTESATAPTTDAAEATPTTASDDGGDKASKASYGKAASKVDCEVPGTCDVKAADPTRPGAYANKYTRGCNPQFGCRG